QGHGFSQCAMRRHGGMPPLVVELLLGGSCGWGALVGTVVSGASVSGGSAVDRASVGEGDAAGVDEVGAVLGAVAVDDDGVADLEVALLPAAAAEGSGARALAA